MISRCGRCDWDSIHLDGREEGCPILLRLSLAPGGLGWPVEWHQREGKEVSCDLFMEMEADVFEDEADDWKETDRNVVESARYRAISTRGGLVVIDKITGDRCERGYDEIYAVVDGEFIPAAPEDWDQDKAPSYEDMAFALSQRWCGSGRRRNYEAGDLAYILERIRERVAKDRRLVIKKRNRAIEREIAELEPGGTDES